MPRLPGSQDVQQVGIARDPGVSVPQPVSSGLEYVAEAVGGIATNMQNAQALRQKQNEEMFIIRAKQRAKYEAQELFNTYQDQDIDDEEVQQKFGAQVREIEQKYIGQFNGSQNGLISLTKGMDDALYPFALQMANKGFEKAKSRREEYYNETRNEGLGRIEANPASLDDEISRYDREIRINKGLGESDPLTGDVDLLSKATREIYTKTAVLSTLKNPTSESVAIAEEMMRDPRYSRSLSPQTRADVASKVLQAMSAISKREEPITVSAGQDIYQKTDEGYKKVIGGREQRPLVSISGGRDEKTFEKGMSELDVSEIKNVRASAEAARQSKPEIDRMRVALKSKNFRTGFAAEGRQIVGRVMNLVGIPDSEIAPVIGSAATADVIDAASAKMATEIVKQGSFGKTNLGLKMVQSSLPALTRTPEGNEVLLDVMERVSNRAIEAQKLAADYRRQYKTLEPDGVQSYFEAVDQLEADDPIINDEMKSRIENASKGAPESWGSIIGQGREAAGKISAKAKEIVGDKKVIETYKLPDGRKGYRYEGELFLRDNQGNKIK